MYESNFQIFREFAGMDTPEPNEFTGKFVLEYHYSCTEYTHIKNIYVFFLIAYAVLSLVQIRLVTFEYYSRSAIIQYFVLAGLEIKLSNALSITKFYNLCPWPDNQTFLVSMKFLINTIQGPSLIILFTLLMSGFQIATSRLNKPDFDKALIFTCLRYFMDLLKFVKNEKFSLIMLYVNCFFDFVLFCFVIGQGIRNYMLLIS